jgi:hypothetical protein
MKSIFSIVILFVFIISCAKEKAAAPFADGNSEEDGRTEMVGQYKVYNENQNYLYDMEISLADWEDTCTSLLCHGLMLNNFADKFDIWTYHSKLPSDSLVNISVNHGIQDFSGYSWHLSRLTNGTEEFNTFHNDTIKLYFSLSNIAYYLTEGTSYFDCDCIHIAVKQ